MLKLRVSISGIMWIVVAIAVGVAALRDASRFSFGAIHLLTQATLGLAILLSIYRRGAARAWWLGFALFGWGYEYAIPPHSIYRSPHLPVTTLLIALKPLVGHPAHVDPPPGSSGFGQPLEDYLYLRIGDDLAAMVVALIGGLLARVVFARSMPGPATAGPAPTPTPGDPWGSRWIGAIVAVWAALVLVAGFAAIRATWTAGFWAGIAFLLTFGLLGLAGLGAILARGGARRSFTGAAMLGGGYLLLVFSHSPYLPLPSGQFLHALRVWFPVLSGSAGPADARILDELERPIPMSFPEPTPLSEVLAHVKRSTTTPGRPEIPIYLDPIGLQEAERSPDSTIAIDLRDVPLRVSLRAALKQLGMDYVVTNGLLYVTSEDTFRSEDEEDPFYAETDREAYHHEQFRHRQAQLWLSADLADPYLIAGHCLLSLLMAGIGGLAGPFLARACGPPAVEPSDPT
jgi:hypothetical protein